jgi:hypothetical protein
MMSLISAARISIQTVPPCEVLRGGLMQAARAADGGG